MHHHLNRILPPTFLSFFWGRYKLAVPRAVFLAAPPQNGRPTSPVESSASLNFPGLETLQGRLLLTESYWNLICNIIPNIHDINIDMHYLIVVNGYTWLYRIVYSHFEEKPYWSLTLIQAQVDPEIHVVSQMHHLHLTFPSILCSCN